VGTHLTIDDRPSMWVRRAQVGSGSAALLAPLQGIMLGGGKSRGAGLLYGDAASSQPHLSAPRFEISHCSWCLHETAHAAVTQGGFFG